MQSAQSVDTDSIFVAIDAIVDVLGTGETAVQKQAFDAFQQGDSARVKRLSTLNLQDSYLRCLGYLVSASKNPSLPTIDTLLAEAARAAADAVKERTLEKLNQALGAALEG